MKNIFRLFAALFLLSTAIACGGSVNDEGDLANEPSVADMTKVDTSEPTTWIAMAKKAAERYSANASLMNIEGDIGPTDGFIWYFTFQGDGSIWTTVQCDGRTAKVISHEKRQFIMGVRSIELKEVKVTFEKLMKIAVKAGLKGRLLHVELAEALYPNAHPHWDVNMGGKTIMVDAYNGSLIK